MPDDPRDERCRRVDVSASLVVEERNASACSTRRSGIRSTRVLVVLALFRRIIFLVVETGDGFFFAVTMEKRLCNILMAAEPLRNVVI
jgi:hypothetical protein